MESKKINQLATNLAPVNTDLTVIGDPVTGELKKITLLQIASLFGGITSIGMVVPSGFSVSPATLTANGTFTISGAGTTAQYIRGDGSLATFPTMLSSDRLIQEVRNNSGATMLKGTIVYINGAVGNKATIAKALATSDATSAQTYGVVQDDIANNSNGYVVVVGEVTGLDTSALSDGQQLYLSGSIAGYYTVTKPYAPIHLVYVAVVLRSHPTLGVLGVKIQNGYEMDELHNVDAVSPSNNDGLFYNTTTSLWEHKQIATALGYTPVTSARTISTTSPLSGGGDLSANRTLSIAQSTTLIDGYLSATDWTTFNNKQGTITLTTTGTSGAATFIANTLNIPQYAGTNIYNADGTLSSARTVTQGANNLTFTGSRTSGNNLAISLTQTSPNASDTGDSTLSVGYTLLSTATTNQLVSRAFSFTATNSLTGAGSSITNLRVVDIQGVTSLSSTTTNLDMIYILGGASALGTVTSSRGLFVRNLQGISQAGVVLEDLSATSTNYTGLVLYSTNGAIPTGDYGIYQYGASLVSYFEGFITANKFTKIGGTSSQFLKADGSVDSTTYSTFSFPTLTSGSVLFSDGTTISQNNAAFFWDNTNSRLGIGIAVPLFGVHCTSGIRGNTLFASTAATIGATTAATTSSILDIISTTKGVLFPRMTNAQLTAIATPATGLMAYATDATEGLYVKLSGGFQRFLTTADGNLYTADGSLSSARAVTHNGFNLTFIGSTYSNRFTSTGRLLLGATIEGTDQLLVTGSAKVTTTITTNQGIVIDRSTSPYVQFQSSATTWGYVRATASSTIVFNDNANTTMSTITSGGLIIGSGSISASAKLQADSTTQGFLPPRMTTTQKNAIASPAAGLIVYDSTLNKLCVRTASAWETITSV